MKVSRPNTVDDMVTLIPRLRAYARSLTRNANDADDLLQETLTKALANLHSFQEGTALRAWLFTIMRNTFFTQSHKRAREQPATDDCVSGKAWTPGNQENHLMGKELMSAIGRLPVLYREMLILVIVLGESYETAAEICHCAIGTVKSRVSRARNLVIADLEAPPVLA